METKKDMPVWMAATDCRGCPYPSTGELVCIKRGESGYQPSSWETGNAEKNRRYADYTNSRRGITPAQEEAMLNGCILGWDTPAADPACYEKHEAAAPSMSL